MFKLYISHVICGLTGQVYIHVNTMYCGGEPEQHWRYIIVQKQGAEKDCMNTL